MNDQQVIDRLRQALDEVTAESSTLEPAPSSRHRSRWMAAARPLAVAATVAALVGGGVLVVGRSADEVGPEPSRESTPPLSSAPPTEPTTPVSATSVVAASEGALIVGGIIRTPDGVPAPNVRVDLYAESKRIPVTETRTDATGAFEIRVRPRALRPLMSDGEFINFDLSVSDVNGFALWSFPRDFRRDGSIIPTPDDEYDNETGLTVLATDGGPVEPPSPPPGNAFDTVESVRDGAPHLDMTLYPGENPIHPQ